MIPTAIERVLLKVQKPARYIGGEQGSVIKNKNEIKLHIAFCFPDVYEVGMSHLGMKIFYSSFNKRPQYWCDRVFAPGEDMRQVMIDEKIPLYGLESFDPLCDFDVIMFTLQYELCYTSVLDMLHLGGVPIYAKDRTGLKNIVMGGGPCVCNPEPIADFFDLFFLGEGEELDLEVLQLYEQAKKEDWSKDHFLRAAAQIEGVYVPSFYDVIYKNDGTVSSIKAKDGAPASIKKRYIENLDEAEFPDNLVVPYIDIVHNRATIEVLRGCIRGCRFCQAGYIYRPFRERSSEVLNRQAKCLCDVSGYDEIGLMSLSTSDHSELEPMMENMLEWSEKDHVDLSLPSLRIDSMTPHLLELLTKVRKSGLTYAPEAGSQRMRDVINKNISEEEVLNTCRMSFINGYTSVKLYFMIGLPTETDEDIIAIYELAQKVVDLFYQMPDKPKGKGVQVTISVAAFVPKPFTPFQFVPQNTAEEFDRKQQLLLSVAKSKKIKVNYHDASGSVIEAILARGDRRLSKVIENVWLKNGRLEGWTDHFDALRWWNALAENSLSADFYAYRERKTDEILPWDHLDYLIDKQFFIREYQLALNNTTSLNCREKCSGCGIGKIMKGGDIHGNCPCSI